MKIFLINTLLFFYGINGFASPSGKLLVQQVVFPGKITALAPNLKYHPVEKTIPILNFPLRGKTRLPVVKASRITLLSDMIASRRTLAEWGFSAFVEVEVPLRDGLTDKRYILFDTGGNPETINSNLESISKSDNSLKGIADLKNFMAGKKLDIVISHWHNDHTAGLTSFLKKYCMKGSSISEDCIVDRIIVGKGFFSSRWEYDAKADRENAIDSNATNIKNFLDPKGEFSSFLPKFMRAESFTNLYSDSDAVWISGFIARKSGENNQASASYKMLAEDGTANGIKIIDDLPEEISLSFNTPNGAVVITGCSHGGVINTLYNLYENTNSNRIDALIGGMHLMAANQKIVEGTINGFKKFEINYILGGHCTGLDVVYQLKAKLIHPHVQASSVMVQYQLFEKEKKAVSIVVNPMPTTLNAIRK